MAKAKPKVHNKVRNFVAKWSLEFNRAAVETDRKKQHKRGYEKHKAKGWEDKLIRLAA